MITLSRRIATAVSLVVTGIVAMGAVASPALAETHPQLSSFGSFTNPNGIAVEESTGDVYVADLATSTIYRFDASGNPVNFSSLGSNALTGNATPAKSFSFPEVPGTPAAIAIDNSCAQQQPSLSGSACEAFDPSAGDLYVMDAGHGVVDKFNAQGEYLKQLTGPFSGELLGLGVDADGKLRVSINTGQATLESFDNSAASNLLSSVSVQGSEQVWTTEHGVAVAPTGDVYQVFSCGCIERFGQNGSKYGRVDTGSDIAAAFDPVTGHLYVDDQTSIKEWDPGQMNGRLETLGSFEATSSGSLVSSFGLLPTNSSGQGGIAVDGASGRIYVASPSDGTVYVFATAVPAADVSSATAVTETEATLHGTVDPRGAPLSSCSFEYATSSTSLNLTQPLVNLDHRVPCEQTPGQIGEGSVPVEVSAHITGLEPGALYRVRLVAANAAGAAPSAGIFPTVGPGFGFKSFEVAFLNQDGTPDTQAGSHPYELVVNFRFNTHVVQLPPGHFEAGIYVTQPDGNTKDIIVDLPSGFSGDPKATIKKCTLAELSEGGLENSCPPESEIGSIEPEISENSGLFIGNGATVPVYSLVPPLGVAFQMSAHILVPNAFIDVGLPAGGDSGLRTTSVGIPVTVPIYRTKVTIFGVPPNGAVAPLLTMPTVCNGPLTSTISADSYQEAGHFATASSVTRNAAGTPGGMTGCAKLEFPPAITVTTDLPDASTSSGLTVGVHVSQQAALNPTGLAESGVRDLKVTLPEGVTINPAGGDGLQACSEGLAGFTGFAEFNSSVEPGDKTATFEPELPNPLLPSTNFCPNGSKIGTVKIKTPVLEHELEGAVYLAAQNANPFGSLVAMYLIAEDPISGTIIKQTGELSLTETGQIVATFKNLPDQPFEEAELHFFGGERAPLSTPSHCGTYTTQATFIPWDGNGPVETSSSFQITSGPHGGPCPGASLPFKPSLNAGTASNQAGGFTPFSMTMSREDGNQNLSSIQLHMPPGLSGTLSNVKLCSEAQANEGTCPEDTLIGETTVSVGVGSDPFTVKGGKVYITEKYEGAPFGLSIVNPAKAGPFDLERTARHNPACDCLVVRAKIEVDPLTAALTITSNPPGSAYSIPTIIEGIPLQIKHINVSINHLEDFVFNPTNCNKMAVTGALLSTEGSSDQLSVPFQVTNCAALSFKPGFAVSTQAKTSRTQGASLTVKLTYPNVGGHSILASGQANIAKVKVELPKQLPSRLSTLQKACTAKVFNANPAACPVASRIGFAKATTPLLPGNLEGPAYFVSNGSAKFPELIVVLTGYQGVTVDLHGETFISKAGITSSTFATVPDVPVGTFELTLPEGPNSALAANGNLCNTKLAMPTEFLSQSGVVLKQNTKVSVTGCKKAIRVIKHKKKAKGKKASITVRVPAAGKLAASGVGLSGVKQSASKAGEVTVELALSKHEQHLLASHHGRMLAAHVKLTFTPSHGETLTSSVMVLLH